MPRVPFQLSAAGIVQRQLTPRAALLQSRFLTNLGWDLGRSHPARRLGIPTRSLYVTTKGIRSRPGPPLSESTTRILSDAPCGCASQTRSVWISPAGRPWNFRLYSNRAAGPEGDGHRRTEIPERADSSVAKESESGVGMPMKQQAQHFMSRNGSWSNTQAHSQSQTSSEESGSSKYFYLPSFPHLPHRPTKEELLAAANGFWHRLKIRFKWVSIRSMRPWNADEWGAFVSWVFLGHIVWILAGTTTFFSLMILSINTVFAQETLATWVGDYLTKSAGVTVVFESAIVPKWRSGVISFRNVFVSRRPGQITSSVSKGSSANAAAVAAAGRHPTETVEEDDGNYTQFDLTIASVNVTLSLIKWWNGKGLLEDVEVKGVRGVVDRTSVRWTPQANDPYSYRYKHQSGDFEIESFKLEDLLVTVYQPNGFRPFAVSIYSCDLDRLRKRWLFYDFLSANHMSGSFDGSLFTIHPRQVHSPIIGGGSQDVDGFQRFSRLRIDGLNIDHLNRGVEGPFGWIYEGNVDIVADVMFPAEVEGGIGKVMSDLYEEMIRVNRARLPNLTADWVPTSYYRHAQQQQEEAAALIAKPEPSVLNTTSASKTQPSLKDDRKYLVMDLRMHLNDVRAAVPLFSRDILVRPIVAYINAKRTYIPITCQIVKRASDFDGSWTVFDCGLMTDMSAHAYDAFARDVEDQQSRVRRLKKVGLWTLSVALHAVFMGMAGQAL